MISVITYGRNDTHGYNLPKRAAISLNCIAEVLSDPDDEIIFVDYNTPNDLPTFIESIYDTLTPRVKGMLRVLRVRPHVHDRLYGGRTHLTALEPISRNIAIRRANPRNRWILSTNTDMIFVPREGTADLTAAVADLGNGHYVLPRFDLPEPLWEGWPRMDPAAVMRECGRLGPALHLHEITGTYPYMRFDSPGDFQLMSRETLFEVFGFDEQMIHGWHADSNMCRRLWRLFGRTESLAGRLKGYHCDHTRVATLVHRLDLKLDNDVNRFVFECNDPYASHQAASWGLPEEPVEEVDFVRGASVCFAEAVQAALGPPQEADYLGDANDTRTYVAYRSEHVLPYVAGYLAAYPPSTRYLYVGANTRMLGLLDRCLAHMPSTGGLRWVAETVGGTDGLAGEGRRVSRPRGTSDETFGRSLVTSHDVLIFDFGFDAADLGRPAVRVTDWPRTSRYRLGVVAQLLEACAEQCHEIFTSRPAAAPDFIVVNANPSVFAGFVSQFLFTTQTPYNIQVRKGRARLGQDRLYRSHRWRNTEEAMGALFGYNVRHDDELCVRPGHAIDFTSLGDGSRHADGHWAAAENDGTWTDGSRANLVLAFDPAHTADLIAEVSIVHVVMRPDGAPIRVNVLLDGERIAHWEVDPRYGAKVYSCLLPSRLFGARPICDLTFDIENPHPPIPAGPADGESTRVVDSRELGIMIRSVRFHGIERTRYQINTAIDFVEGGRGAFYMDSCWSAPDAYGIWTLGSRAELLMYIEDVPQEALVAAFTISDAAISEEFPVLEVDVLFNGQPVDRWRFGPTRTAHDRKIVVRPETLLRRQPLSISFRVASPRSPAALKWSADPRPLGFRLTRMRLAPIPRYPWGETIDFTQNGNADEYLWSNWATPDADGRWTEGGEAKLVLRPDRRAGTTPTASFLITDCMVDRRSSQRLPVQVLVNDTLMDEWTFGPDRTPHVRTLELAAEHVAQEQNLTVAFRVQQPRSPASLGWSDDHRPLGIKLAGACLGGDRLPSISWTAPRRLSAWIPQRARRLVGAYLRTIGATSASGFIVSWARRWW